MFSIHSRSVITITIIRAQWISVCRYHQLISACHSYIGIGICFTICPVIKYGFVVAGPVIYNGVIIKFVQQVAVHYLITNKQVFTVWCTDVWNKVCQNVSYPASLTHLCHHL